MFFTVFLAVLTALIVFSFFPLVILALGWTIFVLAIGLFIWKLPDMMQLLPRWFEYSIGTSMLILTCAGPILKWQRSISKMPTSELVKSLSSFVQKALAIGLGLTAYLGMLTFLVSRDTHHWLIYLAAVGAPILVFFFVRSFRKELKQPNHITKVDKNSKVG